MVTVTGGEIGGRDRVGVLGPELAGAVVELEVDAAHFGDVNVKLPGQVRRVNHGLLPSFVRGRICAYLVETLAVFEPAIC